MGQFVDVPVQLVLEEIAEVIIDESSAVVPLLRIQEHITMLIDEQIVNVSATTSQDEIVESLLLNPQDRVSDCIDEQIVTAPLSQDENIRDQSERKHRVDPVVPTDVQLRGYHRLASGARSAKKRKKKRMTESSCSVKSDLFPLTVVREGQRAPMSGKTIELLRD